MTVNLSVGYTATAFRIGTASPILLHPGLVIVFQVLPTPRSHEINSRLSRLLSLAGVPDSKVHGTNMGPIWGRQDPGGPHVGPLNLAIWGWFSEPVTY